MLRHGENFALWRISFQFPSFRSRIINLTITREDRVTDFTFIDRSWLLRKIFVRESSFIEKIMVDKEMKSNEKSQLFCIVLQTGMISCLCIRAHMNMNGERY